MRGLPLAALLAAGCAAIGPVPATLDDVLETRWYWVAAIENDALTARPEPERYWFEAARTGAVVVQADCNSGVGRRPSPDALAFGPIGTTRRLCGEGSLDARFAELLGGVRDAAFEAGLLRLHAGRADLLFVREIGTTLVRYACPTRSVDILFGERTAHLLEAPRIRALAREPHESGFRYAAAMLSLAGQGDALTIDDRARGTRETCVAVQDRGRPDTPAR